MREEKKEGGREGEVLKEREKHMNKRWGILFKEKFLIKQGQGERQSELALWWI